LGERGCVYTTFLNAKGRFLADALVFHAPTAVLLDVSRAHVPILLPHLLKHRLRTAVTIADESTSWHTLVGHAFDSRESAQLAAAITTTSRNMPQAQAHRRVAAVDPRSPRLGVRVLAPALDHGTARRVQ
jgi:folate-binding Fe-S cluster repair protein YgfZ